jgi:hypothetical protein
MGGREALDSPGTGLDWVAGVLDMIAPEDSTIADSWGYRATFAI